MVNVIQKEETKTDWSLFPIRENQVSTDDFYDDCDDPYVLWVGMGWVGSPNLGPPLDNRIKLKMMMMIFMFCDLVGLGWDPPPDD